MKEKDVKALASEINSELMKFLKKYTHGVPTYNEQFKVKMRDTVNRVCANLINDDD